MLSLSGSTRAFVRLTKTEPPSITSDTIRKRSAAISTSPDPDQLSRITATKLNLIALMAVGRCFATCA
jgi:hypothetical protein